VTHRIRTVAVVAAALLCVPTACGGDTDAEPDGSPSPDADAAVVATAAVQLGQEDLVLGADLAERHLFVLYQVNGGLDATTARCATAGFVSSFGGRTALEGVRLEDLLAEDTQRARRDAARACEPAPEGTTTTVDPFAEQPPEPLPDDLDPALLRDHLVELTTATARQVGMDDEEAACFATAAYGLLDDTQVLATQRPEAYPDVELPERDGAEEVRSCLSDERIAALAQRWRDDVAALRDGQ
jgi:hypothetical protein